MTKAGRPLKYSDPKKLEKAIDEYFNDEDYPTLSGLALHLDLSRQGLLNYSKKNKYFDIYRRARDRVQSEYEKVLVYSKGSPGGAQFALKNMGWRDNTDLNVSGDKKITVDLEKE